MLSLLLWSAGTTLALGQDGYLPEPAQLETQSSERASLANVLLQSTVFDVTDTASGLELRLQELEEAFENYKTGVQEKEADTKQKADEAKKKAEADAKAKPTVKLGGRIHADYWTFPQATPGIGFFENPNPTANNFGQDPQDFFTFRRVRVELEGTLPRSMFWRTQVDFNSPNSPQIKDVYVGFNHVLGDQKVIVGNLKRPLGLDALNSSRFNIFLERPAIIEAFNEDARRVGVLASGSNSDASLNWAYGAYFLENAQNLGQNVGDAYQMGGNARLHGSPYYENDGRDWLHWGIAGMFAQPNGDASPAAATPNQARFRSHPEARTPNRWLDTGTIAGATYFEIAALEAMYNKGPFHVCSEYQVNFLQRDNVTPGTGPNLFFHGGYVQVAYFLTGEHMAYKRDVGQLDRLHPCHDFLFGEQCENCNGPGWGAWQIAARYSIADLSDADITGGFEKTFTLALNWHWTAYAKLQFNAVKGTIDERGPIGGYSSGDFTILGTRLAIDY